jgi:hypothetical protein
MRGAAFFRAKAGRRDSTHAAIRDGLRKLGYLVVDLAGAAGGTYDLLVFSAFGRPTFIECKAPKGKLRDSQVAFARRLDSYDVRHGVARTLDEALVLVGHHVRSRIEANARDVERKADAVVKAMGAQ